MGERDKKQIGRILLQQKAIRPDQLERALAGPETEGRLASRLAREGTITDIEALKALSEQHGIPGIDLAQICLRLEDLGLLPREIAEKHLILPVLSREDRLFVAMADPREKRVIDELEFVTGKRVFPYVALETVLAQVIDAAYAAKIRGEAYYVGPNCPAEVLRKVGIEADGTLLAREGGAAHSAMTSPPSANLESAAMVVDDAVGRASREDDVESDDFGDVSPELSVVSDLIDPGPPGIAGQRTILVVDDEPDIRTMLARLLRSRGYHVIEAERGMQALRLVKEYRPDLIVLDAMLPEVHGFDIARRIKGSRRYGHIPIIMVSAVYRGWRYAEDLKASYGVHAFIEKPFRIADVTRAVEQALAREMAGEDAEPTETSKEAEAALNAGVAAYKAGRIDEAIGHLQRGIAIDPLAYRLHFHLGLLYGKQNKTYEAISELETAVEINPRHFPAIKNLAVLYQKAGFRNKAAEMWQRSLLLAPDEEMRQSIKQHLLQLL
ncbi:MAG: response regulator [Polyangiaceae bacterium]|nr:response regulator [Polyangiaceae bacterium]